MDGFSPFRINTSPVTTSSSLSCPARPWRGTPPVSMVLMSWIRTGVPPCWATTMLPMSSRRLQHADTANQILLLAFIDVSAAGIGAAATERREELLQRDAVSLHPGKVRLHLILFDETAIGDDVGNARNRLELPCHRPVLDGPQLGGRHVALQAVS